MPPIDDDKIVIPDNPAQTLSLADLVDPTGELLGEDPAERIKRATERPEELHPDLQPYVVESERFGQQLKHPLVFSMIHAEFMNAMVNAQYRAKKKILTEYRAKGKYADIVWLHERPYRLQAFLSVAEELTDTKYWELLGGVWSDSENVWQDGPLWRAMLESKRTSRWAFMDKEERDALKVLRKKKQPLLVYRGYCNTGSRLGLSWTLEYKRAEWFARRFASMDHADTCEVACGTVDPANVIGHLLGRGEAEIVAFPEHVDLLRVDVL